MRTAHKVTAVGAAALAMVLSAGTAAHAGSDATSSTDGSWSRFINVGDKFENCDTKGDLMISYVKYQYVRKDGSLQTGSHYNPGGNGDCTTWDHDFGEGRSVQFSSCVDDPIFADRCDAWRQGIA